MQRIENDQLSSTCMSKPKSKINISQLIVVGIWAIPSFYQQFFLLYSLCLIILFFHFFPKSITTADCQSFRKSFSIASTVLLPYPFSGELMVKTQHGQQNNNQ